MGNFSKGIGDRPRADAGNALLHGQYLAQDFPVL